MAKIMIEIDDKTFGRIFHRDCIGEEYDYEVTRAIVNGIALPDNATNGDVIKALFPDAENIRVDNGLPLNFVLEFELHRNYKDWWNTLYKAGDTEPQKREEVYAESNN